MVSVAVTGLPVYGLLLVANLVVRRPFAYNDRVPGELRGVSVGEVEPPG